MKQINKNKIILLIVFALIMIILLFNNQSQAAGVNGTVIVLNPRSWWNVGRLC